MECASVMGGVLCVCCVCESQLASVRANKVCQIFISGEVGVKLCVCECVWVCV